MIILYAVSEGLLDYLFTYFATDAFRDRHYIDYASPFHFLFHDIDAL